MRVRLQDVARRASVSMQTVSRVLRNPDLVAPETAERVRIAMEELGYVKNEQATALRLGRTRTIGLLLPLLAWPFWAEVAAGAEARAHERGYSLLLCDTSDSPAKEEEYLSLLLGYQVAGIVYCVPRCRPETHPMCAQLIQSEVPVVVLSSVPHDLPYSHVHTDDRRAGYVAMRHLLDLGRRRIAIIVSNQSVPDEDSVANEQPFYERVLGARDALVEVGLGDEAYPVFFTANTSESGRAVGQRLLSAGSARPDALFCTSDTVSFGLLEALRLGGMHIPGDIAVVSHDGLPASVLSVPALTTIAPRAREMGAICVERLLLSADIAQELVTDTVEADLIVRASTIGSGLVPSQGIASPISADHAWSQWRMQSMPTTNYKEIAVTSIPLNQMVWQEGDL
jgi:LacI family transcriptional regulator